MEFAGFSLSDLLSPFAVVLDEEEASLDLPLELPDLLLDLVSVLDFPIVVEEVAGGCVVRNCGVCGLAKVLAWVLGDVEIECPLGVTRFSP